MFVGGGSEEERQWSVLGYKFLVGRKRSSGAAWVAPFLVFRGQCSVLSKERDEENAKALTGRLSAIRKREKARKNYNAPTGSG
jgi:hypothetical protein